ncbi:MAG: trypsin-like peptidase domain-containing protein [Oligoflexia bacterium]|nr:trypsin-like peptidase domain-containing protein [Oligoflexia bacterium]
MKKTIFSGGISVIFVFALSSALPGCSPAQTAAATADEAPPRAAPLVTAATAPLAPPVTGDPNIFVALAKKVVPSVVNISTAKLVRNRHGQGDPHDFFRRFFEDFGNRRGPRQDQPVPRATSLGTGFVVDASGLILTNNHVVADADEIKITFTENANEKPVDGEVVGRDAELDVALIRVKGKKDLVPLVLGDSEALEVGEYVVAVGNPFGQGHSVTHGIISAKERTVPGLGAGLSNYLQTDAPINPGNSGGPLINLRGEVIGINNAIDARAQGIGFAIPISTVKRILPQLRSKGSVERGYIGAVIGELNPELAEKLGVDRELRAPFVTSVEPDGPADRAGIRPYDIIVKVNGVAVHSSSTLIGAVTAIPVGETARFELLRDGKEKRLSVKAGKRPNGEARPTRNGEGSSEEQLDIGAELEEVKTSRGHTGVAVSAVAPSGPATEAGLSPGDLILEVDRKPVASVRQFFELAKPGKSHLLRVKKGGTRGFSDVYAVVILDLSGR